MCAPTAALTPLEIAVGGGGTALPRFQPVCIHRQTHRATRLAPFKPGVEKNLVQPFVFGHRFDQPGPRHHHRANMRGHFFAFGNRGCGTQIFDAPIGARTDEHAVHLYINQLHARLQIHIGERAFNAFAFVRLCLCWIGHDSGNRQRLFRRGTPCHHRHNVGGVQRDLDIEFCIIIAF